MNLQNENPFPLPDLGLVYVEGGSFMMGDEKGDLWNACRPVHEIQISSFYIGKYPVTQRLWQAVMGNNPSRFKSGLRPVEMVSWHETQNFIKKLNGMEKVQVYLRNLRPAGDTDSYRYRLPREAEWEFAARERKKSGGFLYAGSDKLKEVGWYDTNSYRETKPVGLKFPNALGIYDMSGNVWEWCEDWYESYYYKKCLEKGLVVDPPGAEKGGDRVSRGGSCFSGSRYCRCSYRSISPPEARSNSHGFRLALSPQWSGSRRLTREQKSAQRTREKREQAQASEGRHA